VNPLLFWLLLIEVSFVIWNTAISWPAYEAQMSVIRQQEPCKVCGREVPRGEPHELHG
jgi:hypothetical protein